LIESLEAVRARAAVGPKAAAMGMTDLIHG
jgi:hypothetical protein